MERRKIDELKGCIQHGRKPFPINPKSKTPCTAHGFKDASDDMEKIITWMEEFPNCGWGTPTSYQMFVVDVDNKNGGIQNWCNLSASHNQEEFETVTVRTQNGGLHYYFSAPNGTRINNSTGNLPDGIDVRGEGGYVAIPPTDGYEYIKDYENTDIIPAPDWLIENITAKHTSTQIPVFAEIEPVINESEDVARAVLYLASLNHQRVEDYQSWVEVGMSLTQLGEIGLHLWDAWSRKSPKYKLGECAQKWKTFKQGEGLKFVSLRYWAMQDSPQGITGIPEAPQRSKPSDYMRAIEIAGWDFKMNEANYEVEINGIPYSGPIESIIRTEFREHGYLNMAIAEDVIIKKAFVNRFHPIKDYLERLNWDGEDHIANLASYFTDKNKVFDKWLRYWLIGAVARVMESSHRGAQNRMLVIDGKQNLGKSFFVRWLADEVPSMHLEGPIDPTDKDNDLRLLRVWIWEVAELGSTVRKADREALKFFISKQTVTVRKHYGKKDIKRPAISSFIGTINNEAGFLTDPTGHRRFMVATLTDINWSYTKDVEVGQVWAQAHALYRKGEKWELEGDDYFLAEEISSEYELDDPLLEYILEGYEINSDEKEWFTPTTEIISHLRLADHIRGIHDRSAAMQIGGCMKKLDLERGRKRIKGERRNGWYGVRERRNEAVDKLFSHNH